MKTHYSTTKKWQDSHTNTSDVQLYYEVKYNIKATTI